MQDVSRETLIKAIHKNADLVAQLGCIACYKIGYYETPAEIHHLRCDAGAGQKSDRIIPLCSTHHRLGYDKDPQLAGFHSQPEMFEKTFGTENELHKLTEELLEELQKNII